MTSGTFAACLVCIAVFVSAPAALQNPPGGKKTVTKTMAPPRPQDRLENWDQALAHADTVLRVRITARHYVKVALPVKPFSADKTRYSAEVLEVLRAPVEVGSAATIFRGPGIVEMPTEYVKLVVPGYPEWTLHTEYLLLLTWDPVLNGFNDAYGADGTFKLASGKGRVESTGQAPFSKDQHGRPIQSVLNEARAKSRGR